MTDDLDTLTRWTPVAYRKRRCSDGQRLRWKQLEDAPILIDDAHRLRDAGLLLMMSRHRDDLVIMEVVKAPPVRVGRRRG